MCKNCLKLTLSLVVLSLSLGAARALAAGVAVGVEVGGAAGDAGRADPTEAQLKQAAYATGEADLVAVIKVTEVAEPKKDEAGDKKDEAKPNVLGLGVVRMGGRGAGTEKLFTAEITELLKGDREAKTVKIQASVIKNGPSEYMLITLEREWKDANGAVARKFTQQMSVPFTLAKDKSSLVFLKFTEMKKDDQGKAGERSCKLIQPLFDGAPEKALAAVKEAVKRIEEWKDPPKLSAEDQVAIEKLIKQLGDNDYMTRETATKELIAKGAAIKGLLETAAKSEDAEIKQRAAQVLEAIKPEFMKPQDPSGGVGTGTGVMMMQNGVQMQMGVGQ